MDVKNILVALGYDDEHNYSTLSWAKRVADKTNADIELIHVLEEEDSFESVSSPYATYDGAYPMTHLARSHRDEMSQRLSSLSQEFSLPVGSWHLERGDLTQTLNQTIDLKGIDLLVIGVRDYYGAFLSQYTSDALRIIDSVDIPTLLVPEHSISRKDESIHMLFASDLRPESESFFRQALEWGKEVKSCTFTALHVIHKEVSLHNVFNGFKSFLQDSTSSAARILHERRALTKSELRKRIKHYTDTLKLPQSMRTTSMALQGRIEEQIALALRRTLANLLVVGRHSYFHSSNGRFGKMPFRKMGGFGVPVLVTALEYTPEQLIQPQLRELRV